MKKLTIATLFATIFATSTMAAETEERMVQMKGVDGNDLGYIMLKERKNGFIVQARLENIPEGWHGFHIHEIGSCAEAFKAAKGHFYPKAVSKDVVNHDKGRYGGDLPNIYATADGSVRADIFTTELSLASNPKSVLDSDGSSFIVHEKTDSYGGEAGAGGRIACGVISSGT